MVTTLLYIRGFPHLFSDDKASTLFVAGSSSESDYHGLLYARNDRL